MSPVLVELAPNEVIEDVEIMVTVTLHTNQGEIDEVFYSLEEAEEYLDKVEALK